MCYRIIEVGDQGVILGGPLTGRHFKLLSKFQNLIASKFMIVKAILPVSLNKVYGNH